MNEPEEINCQQCENAFAWIRPERYQRAPRLCESCATVQREKNLRTSIETAEASILRRTPLRYRATDADHPDFNLKLWQRVKSWQPSEQHPWLGMVGPTGRCKTRAAFMLLREVFVGSIRPVVDPDQLPRVPSVMVVSAYNFAEAVAAQFTDQKDDAVDFLRRLRTGNFLLIDDLGKQRNTPAVTSELFSIVDHRHAQNLPTIWTANSPPEGIVSGMAEDMAAPLVGRLRECSTIINIS
ncbi:MAG: hypothetical protein ABIT37_08860 [Luteolibacter sp.]